LLNKRLKENNRTLSGEIPSSFNFLLDSAMFSQSPSGKWSWECVSASESRGVLDYWMFFFLEKARIFLKHKYLNIFIKIYQNLAKKILYTQPFSNFFLITNIESTGWIHDYQDKAL
jgi:hypothetical protein